MGRLLAFAVIKMRKMTTSIPNGESLLLRCTLSRIIRHQNPHPATSDWVIHADMFGEPQEPETAQKGADLTRCDICDFQQFREAYTEALHDLAPTERPHASD